MSVATVFGGTADAQTALVAGPACTGGNLASGTYTSLTVSGECYIPDGTTVTVTGNLIVSAGAMLDAVSPGGAGSSALLGSALPGTLVVNGNISVGRGAALLLGWCVEPNGGSGSENCDRNEQSSPGDSVSGNISATGAESVIIHGVSVGGSVVINGGGGGVQCVTPTLFSDDSDPAINGSQSIGYDFDPVNYDDLESSTIGRGVIVENLNSCWFGAVRDDVTRSFTFDHNTMADGDGDEVVGNAVGLSMACVGNSPAVQFGDSGAAPDVVAGSATGQCAAPISEKPVSWTTPPPVEYSEPLSSTQLDATSPLSGTFVYDPGAGTVLGLGSHRVSVTFTFTLNDTTDAISATLTKVITVTKSPTTTLLSTTSPITYGSETNEVFSVAVSAPSGAVPPGTFDVDTGSTVLCSAALNSSGDGTCSLPTDTRLAVGSHAIDAVYLATTDYAHSVSAVQTLVVNQ